LPALFDHDRVTGLHQTRLPRNRQKVKALMI